MNGGRTETKTVRSYLDLLPPTDHGPAGRVWEWMMSHGVVVSAHQERGGPVYGIFYTRHGRHVVNIGDTVARSTEDGVVMWAVYRTRAVES